MKPQVWLFDLDNTLHDAGHAAFGELHVAMGEYIVEHLGVRSEEAAALRQRYWLRYGATLLGLVRHHNIAAAHFLAETHRLPGLESRLRMSAPDRAAVARLRGRKIIVTNAPRDYAMRVLRTLRLARLFDAVIAIEDMTMFGALRPKPDARMLRRLAARLQVAPSRCVLVEDTLVHLKAARRVGMRAVWMQRYLRAGERPPLPEAALPLCQNRRAAAPDVSSMTPPSESPAASPGDIDGDDASDTASPLPDRAIVPGADSPLIDTTPVAQAPAPRRASAADSRDVGDDAAGARRRAHHHRGAGGQAVGFGSGAVPPFREQGADVRGPDRVHRAERLHARQPDRRARAERFGAGASRCSTVLLQFGEKNPGMTRVMVGDALVFENERLIARMNQFFERIESQLRQSLRASAEAHGSTTPTVDASAQASALTAFADRPAAALRPLGLSQEPDRAPRGRAAPVRFLKRSRGEVATTILAGGRPLTLLPEKAAFIEASRTLLVADVHIGKAVSFRALGVPVPRGTTSETLAALGALVAKTAARRDRLPRRLPAFGARARGGDARRRRAPGAKRYASPRAGAGARQPRRPRRRSAARAAHRGRRRALAATTASRLCHHPRPRAGAYVLAGHLHPCVGIGGRAFDHLRLPCFWFGDAVGVLPAFGAFTGMHPIRAAASDRVFPIADRTVALIRRPDLRAA